MSLRDIAAELKRAGRLRRSLDALAALYEKAVLEASMEPFEVRLSVKQSTDHLGDKYHGVETTHIIDGQSLQAAYDVWQGYVRIERALLEQSN